MICEHCGTYMPDEALTCDHCGSLLHSDGRPRETGVRALRQGRQGSTPASVPDEPRQGTPEYGDYELSPLPLERRQGMRRKTPTLDSFASRPNTRRGVPVHTGMNSAVVRSKHVKTHSVKAHGVNWMKVGLVCVVLLLLLAVGYYFYMQSTDEGQRATARRMTLTASEELLALAQTTDVQLQADRDTVLSDLGKASPQAYWLVGQEYLDMGDMQDAITALRIADILDPDNYDGLLSLSSAYELDGDDQNAESIYLRLTTVSPSRTDAYTALIRLYQDTDQNPKAAEMMKLAYANTEKESFRQQRADFIPNTPEVDLTAGRYELERTVHLTSPQGYDVYYTTDNDAVLPEGGTLLHGDAMVIPEGSITLRAVCVSGDLVSDEMKVSYVVYYPSPAAPKCNVAPNTYTKAKEVTLRPGIGDEKETLDFYYTIDGTVPDTDGSSPKYEEPIKVGGTAGYVTLRAIAVNSYGKTSSTLEVIYKFNVKTRPMDKYSEADVFDGFRLGSTTQDEFAERFGQPASVEETAYLNSASSARKAVYDWGSADFLLTGTRWILVRVDASRKLCDGPRNVGFGASESDITAAYKDYGQPQSPDGSRGLYHTDYENGRVLVGEDGERIVQYSCLTAAAQTWVLQYWLKGDRVVRVVHYYQP